MLMLTKFRRFEDYYIPVPESGCWLWLGWVNRYGYGDCVHAKPRLIHRFAWLHFKGPIPKGMRVCHKCDVRSCVNPNHLFLGTAKDNTADMIAKGRQRRPTPTKFCPHGHEYTPENTYSLALKSGRKTKRCRTCVRIKTSTPEFRARYRELALRRQQRQTEAQS